MITKVFNNLKKKKKEREIGNRLLVNFGKVVRWNSLLLTKININYWRVENQRLPTRVNLDSCGIDIHSTRCLICHDNQETDIHLFVDCKVARELWDFVFAWWKMPHVILTILHSAITRADKSHGRGKQNKHFDIVVQTTIWLLLKYRNGMTFDTKKPRKETIGDDVKLPLDLTWK